MYLFYGLCIAVFCLWSGGNVGYAEDVYSGNDYAAYEAQKNDAADQILARETLPTDYANSLLSEFDSEQESLIWKNYILQKLDVLYLHPDVDPDMRPMILARLWRESRSPIPTFAGTSQMTLLRLHEKQPEIVSADKLSNRCLWVIERPAYSNSDRLSALHVLSSLDQAKASEIARIWLKDPTTAPMLQLTAISVLGQNPTLDANDRSLVDGFANNPDLRLRTAAKKALAIDE